MILNENDSRTMPSLRFTVDKKRHKRITSIFSIFQNAFTENVDIHIYGGRYALV